VVVGMPVLVPVVVRVRVPVVVPVLVWMPGLVATLLP
jgi:hypothetical protein